MERVLKGREYSISKLFENVGAGNYLHVPLSFYSLGAVSQERTRQNKYAQCKPLNEKFTTSTTIKKGYITIYQRY